MALETALRDMPDGRARAQARARPVRGELRARWAGSGVGWGGKESEGGGEGRGEGVWQREWETEERQTETEGEDEGGSKGGKRDSEA